MNGPVLNVCMGAWVLFVCGVFALTLASLPPPYPDCGSDVHDDEPVRADEGYVMMDYPFGGSTFRQMREEERKQREQEERRVCGRDAKVEIVDQKCNATLLFDLPANTTISLRKHLRSHARLKRRVLTLERMMRVVMAYTRLGVGLRTHQKDEKMK